MKLSAGQERPDKPDQCYSTEAREKWLFHYSFTPQLDEEPGINQKQQTKTNTSDV